MIDYAALKTKIDADHAGDTEEQIVVALNEKNTAGKQPIKSFDIQQYLFVNGLWIAVKKGASEAAEEAMDGLSLFDKFDIRAPENETALIRVLDALVADTQIPSFTPAHKTGILAMGAIMESWADQNFGRDVTIKDIRVVRG